MIVIVMGVSGSGKSYLAQHFAEVTCWPFAEGDDYHSEANKAKMAARIPLTDVDRAPWLAALHQVMLDWHAAGSPGILTCSALKASYRAELSEGLREVRFVWLDPPREVILERLKHRAGHYMPPELLDSQLATLEPPAGVLRLDGSEPIGEAIRRILAWLDGNPESSVPPLSSNPID